MSFPPAFFISSRSFLTSSYVAFTISSSVPLICSVWFIFSLVCNVVAIAALLCSNFVSSAARNIPVLVIPCIDIDAKISSTTIVTTSATIVIPLFLFKNLLEKLLFFFSSKVLLSTVSRLLDFFLFPAIFIFFPPHFCFC